MSVKAPADFAGVLRQQAKLRCGDVGECLAHLEALTANVRASSRCTMELDMSGVNQVDSRVLSRLIGLGLTLRRGGGSLILENLQPELADLLDQMRLLDGQFEVRKTETF
ncbi:hypothetical protein DPQ33_03130 [Oceanidesulfovibrio indonesiensis]|uniref:STAS domain-containing protein n=1 Tax=Oceanidesulfovibrio indonesiensis TaxID=54767 RepID=A0A7M3MI47_9BACT|nr:STAS domain-containing protein [Oceanidesulfovibrio indonesiensis]TVM19368.1 hypothetical protein DPQ33_03130 [Oceanidesulfovibrio indonesiensis]